MTQTGSALISTLRRVPASLFALALFVPLSMGVRQCEPVHVPDGCDYDGDHYDVGDGFKSSDGCNDCSCQADGSVVCTKRACEPQTCGGLQGKACPDAQYCDFAAEAQCGAADQTGTCKARPEICTQIYAPVCGCDDKTYGNACEAAAKGVSVRKTGECEKPSAGCDYGGKHYDAGEGFPSTDGCNSCGCQADGSVVCTTKACVPQTCGGLKGATCPDKQYCDFAPEARCGAADQTGLCKGRPDACDEIYKPVCGCDDKTYANACEAAAAGVSVRKDGSCEPVSSGSLCGGLQGNACPDKEYCEFAPDAQCGAADQTGSCKLRPEACTRIYKPVCGCDDKTYANACEAATAGVSVLKDGACEAKSGCDYGGKHYEPGQGFPSTDGCNSCSCTADGQVACTLKACIAACGGITGLQCKDGQYCSFAPDAQCGAADQTGLCVDKPEICTAISDPVCGCDDKTYASACVAASKGISVLKKGACN